MFYLFLGSAAVLAYVLVGYPVLLQLLVKLRGARPIRRADITPRLSFVISAYNEADVIRTKLENALELDYPDGAREIVVISDCSSDGTDDIVREFAERGVVLARMGERRGKTAGLNATVPSLSGEVVVFSDANAIYERDALRKLVRNFADDTIGYVTGEARYLKSGEAAADVGERAYWNYEIQMKRLETQLGSMVGGDGAIYAIRRTLWQALPEDAINDFLNPLQIVAAGWRGVYEPEAVCWEDTAGGTKTEYKRRVRIVSRSWRAVYQATGVLNPFKVGLFAWSLFSHKVLRWVSGVFAVGLGIGFAWLYAGWLVERPGPVLAITGALAALIAFTRRGRQAASMAAYFAVINVASLVGIYKGTIGRVSGVWSTPRETAARPVGVLLPIGPLFLIGCVVAVGAAAWYSVQEGRGAAIGLFWASVGALFYIYAFYPAMLAVLRVMARQPHDIGAIEPHVCLFVAANDEASVIAAKIRNALELEYPADRLDIVIASDGSTDGTNAIVKQFAPRVRLLEFAQRAGKISTIIKGIEAVTADIVVFSDANTFLDADAIRSLVRNFSDPSVGCVSGDVVLVGDRAMMGRSEDLYYRYERWMQLAESEIGSMIGADGALYAVRRQLFSAPMGDTILDDMAIPMGVLQKGYRVVIEPLATAHEQGVASAKEEFLRKSRVVAGAIQFLSRKDSSVPLWAPQVMLSLLSHKALRWLSPAFALCTFVSSLVIAGSSPTFTIVAFGELGLLGLGLAGCSPPLRRLPLVGLSHYFCLVQAAAAAGFVRGLTGRQSVLWRRFVRPPLAEASQATSGQGYEVIGR
jgi:cellulose synthase/poly-beta-1,6-N-acetylglucosamine synthase-like glycosyltransferase